MDHALAATDTEHKQHDSFSTIPSNGFWYQTWRIVKFVLLNAVLPYMINVIGEWCQTAVKDHYHPDGTDRVLSHLRASFTQPERLLQAMAQGNFLLSGYRALDFFVPGSSNAQSDWDFYCHGSAYCVGFALRALEDNGVVWHDAFEPLRRIIRAGPRTTHAMHLDDLREFIRRLNSASSSMPEARVVSLINAIDLALRTDRNSQTIGLPSGKVLRVLRGELPLPLYPTPTTNLVTGRTTYNHTNQTVRLIFSRHFTPIEHVLAFHSSAAQCCITGFSAFHFYYRLAAQRRGKIWLFNTQHPSQLEEVRQKQELQGWRLSRTSHEQTSKVPRLFQITRSSISKYLRFELAYGFPAHVVRAKRTAVENIAWEEGESQTRLLRSYPRSLTDVFAAEHRFRKCMSFVDSAMAAAKEKAMSHAVAIRPDQDDEFPHEVSIV